MRTNDGREIRLRRLSAGISQQDLARAAGLTSAKLCRFERGQSARLTAEELERLMACLSLLISQREVRMDIAIS